MEDAERLLLSSLFERTISDLARMSVFLLSLVNRWFMSTELTLGYSFSTNGTFYLDLMKDLSAVNRRLYRQGKVLTVRGVTVVNRDTGTTNRNLGTTG